MFVLVDNNLITEIAVAMEQNCKEQLKPTVGMVFDTLTDVERFYKSYAHENGFNVRVGQHKK
jgi:hypothetical protein